MSERDFAIQLATLAEAFGEQKLTPVRIEAYHRNLKDVPVKLLTVTVDRMIREIGSNSFRWTALPPVADIRKWAEIVRREEIPKHRIGECDACKSTRWKPVLVSGVERVEKCHCLAAHAATLEHYGLPASSLASLPPAREEQTGEPEDYPTRRQLPEPLQDRFSAVTGRKGLS